MLGKDIISYKKCENEDKKMDFLSDYDNNPSDEFIKFLLNEFDNEEDEFLQVEIIKFITTHRQKSNEIKEFFLDKMLLNNELDEMVLSHIAQNLIFFELNSSEFEKIYEKILLEEQEDDKREDFISALLRLLYIKRDKGANVYLDALKKHEIYFG
jgi:hypothetical protein